MRKIAQAMLGSVLLSSSLTVPAMAVGPQERPGKHPFLPHYILFDVGSFGGGFSTFCYPNCRQLNQHGDAVGIDATSRADPFVPCFVDCHIDHAFEWKDGGTNDLGALRAKTGSWGQGINEKGIVAGISLNGQYDPDTGFWEVRAVRWKNGKIKDLGTLGGTQSNAWMVNNSGQVVADALTSDTNDPYLGVPQANCKWLPTTGPGCGGLDFGTNTIFFPLTTTVHGTIWSDVGNLADLGTLGGPDSSALDINDAGQIVGWSYTSYDAGLSGVPDTHPFVWQDGTMTDLGSPLGGTFAAATLINQNGQIAGVANTTGDAEVHAVVWDSDLTAHDCGTLGSDYGHPDWMNESGDIVGFSRTADQLGRAFVCWHTNHQMTDLGIIGNDPESEATGINSQGVIIGGDFDRNSGDLRGWVSDQGGPITDLNTLIRNAHGLQVIVANTINDRGTIAANAVTRKGEEHAVILVPEDDAAMLAQMDAAMSRTSNQGAMHAPALFAPARASSPGCAASRWTRPHYCTGA